MKDGKEKCPTARGSSPNGVNTRVSKDVHVSGNTHKHARTQADGHAEFSVSRATGIDF